MKRHSKTDDVDRELFEYIVKMYSGMVDDLLKENNRLQRELDFKSEKYSHLKQSIKEGVFK